MGNKKRLFTTETPRAPRRKVKLKSIGCICYCKHFLIYILGVLGVSVVKIFDITPINFIAV